jgi:hypothetical protein
MADLPVCLLCASFGLPEMDMVTIKIRLSGEPEGNALINQISLGKFRDILIYTFEFGAEDVDRKIAEMKTGNFYNFTLLMKENGLYKIGLLTTKLFPTE